LNAARAESAEWILSSDSNTAGSNDCTPIDNRVMSPTTLRR
jgi:hypothetical protein